MKDLLQKIKKEAEEKLSDIKDSQALRELETKYLGRKGELTKFLRKIADLSVEEKKEIGKTANEIKKDLISKFNETKKRLEGSEKNEDFVDVTLPGKSSVRGHVHPITAVKEELEELFSAMGFMVLEGPELESDHFNFNALNIPSHHPARDMQDTFYIDPETVKGPDGQSGRPGEYDLVMRTQTSPMQIRAMKRYGAPLRCVVPGRVFRSEAIDANHETNFYQLEGLMVDENISLANLISVLKEMLSGVFKKDVKIRVRPGYFPFVEPGLEVDMACTICGGPGCPSCKHSGWLEMIGAGMVHLNVLKAGGVDPEKYSGFAFGMGIDRLVMMRYGINDIRLFHSGDLRFLEQF